MKSDSEEFFDAESSFHEPDKQSVPKPYDSEEQKLPDLKSSNHSNIKSSIIGPSRSLQHQPSIKAIPITIKFSSKKKQPDFKNIRLLQEIDLIEKENFVHWVLKFSEDCNYLSVSGTNGQIYIYNTAKRSANYISSSPEKILNRHTAAVTSLSWSKDNKLVSAGKDNKAILWDPTNEEPLTAFDHPAQVTCCLFYTKSSQHFLTACKDKLLRVFKINETKPLAYYQLTMNCYSLDFDLYNRNLAVGTNKGEVILYTVRDDFHLRLFNTIVCKNRNGIHSKGKKVVGVKFVSLDWVLITTADSRIRLVNYVKNELVQKFKGLKNLKAKICADYSLKDQTLVCGSEDGKVYFWKQEAGLAKNGKFECFRPRMRKTVEYAMFAPNKIEEDVRARFVDGDVKHVMLTIGAKDVLKIFLVLSK